jgi:ATP-binding cassette subfamily E protein 1
MPKPKIVLDYQRCEPGSCQDGICAAARVCKKKVLRQEKAGEMPDFYPNMCLGCSDCLSACPRGAIQMMR